MRATRGDSWGEGVGGGTHIRPFDHSTIQRPRGSPERGVGEFDLLPAFDVDEFGPAWACALCEGVFVEALGENPGDAAALVFGPLLEGG